MENKKSLSMGLTTRQLTVTGMLAAISIILGLTGYGFIPLPTAKATIMHIPVIIGAIIEGPMVGVLIGLLFGLFSIFQAIVAPNILSFVFINPLVSVLPRMLIGVTAYYCCRLPIKNEMHKVGISAVVGTLTNTVGVLSMIYFLYAAEFAAVRNIDPTTVRNVIYGIAVTNGIPEAIISAVITVPVVMMIRKVRGNG